MISFKLNSVRHFFTEKIHFLKTERNSVNTTKETSNSFHSCWTENIKRQLKEKYQSWMHTTSATGCCGRGSAWMPSKNHEKKQRSNKWGSRLILYCVFFLLPTKVGDERKFSRRSKDHQQADDYDNIRYISGSSLLLIIITDVKWMRSSGRKHFNYVSELKAWQLNVCKQH